MDMLGKRSYLIFLSLLFVLFGCQSNNANADIDSSKNNNEEVHNVEENLDNEDLENDGNELTEGPLLKVGQWLHEGDGTKVTLTAIDSDERVLDLDPIIMTIQDVKLMEREGGSFDGNVIQIGYTIENTSNNDTMFGGIDVITTDAKQQIEVSVEDISGEFLSSEYHGNVKKEGYIIVPYNGEIKSLKLITSDVWDNNEMTKINNSITEEISFD